MPQQALQGFIYVLASAFVTINNRLAIFVKPLILPARSTRRIKGLTKMAKVSNQVSTSS